MKLRNQEQKRTKCVVEFIVVFTVREQHFELLCQSVTFLIGAFLVPYVLFLLTCGIPMFLLETAMGQFTSQGCITCWRHFCPLFEGQCVSQNVIILIQFWMEMIDALRIISGIMLLTRIWLNIKTASKPRATLE